MGYDLVPRNKDVDGFHFGAFSFPILLEACGFLWPVAHGGAKWYCVFGEDPRMPEGDSYPRLLSNDGFRVTAEEARIMGRMASNYVAIQRSLTETNRAPDGDWLKPPWEQVWPSKIRDDFVDRFAEFAEWAPKSGGFQIW